MPVSEPEPQTGTVSLASTAGVTLVLLIASIVMLATCSRLLAPAASFEDRWPHEPFKFLDKHSHLPRAPLMPWWNESVIV
jgi:hypothetical protein